MTEHEFHKYALEPGTMLQEFEIQRVLGDGGFGITYLAYDTDFLKWVAIKEYLPIDFAVRLDDSRVAPRTSGVVNDYEWGLKAFIDEARTLHRFDHPNIVRAKRVIRANDTAYIVMDYVQGETLEEYVSRSGKITDIKWVKLCISGLISGLMDVHAQEFYHRDVKPGNILIQENGSPVLIDFGAARQKVEGKSRPMTAIITPGYAPLEQYSTKGKVGPWTDIYGLAAVAYHCLTGAAPEEATNRILGDKLMPLSNSVERGDDNAFLKAIDQGLALDIGDRPQSLSEWKSTFSTPESEERTQESGEGDGQTVLDRELLLTHIPASVFMHIRHIDESQLSSAIQKGQYRVQSRDGLVYVSRSELSTAERLDADRIMGLVRVASESGSGAANSEGQENGGMVIACRGCGADNTESSKYCRQCGRALAEAPQEGSTDQGSRPVNEDDPVSAYYDAAIGPDNTEYYLSAFRRFDNGGKRASWNWPACFVTFYWLLYRKMRAFAVLYIVLYFLFPYFLAIVIRSVVGNPEVGALLFMLIYIAAMFIACPVYANKIYHRHVRNIIRQIISQSDDIERNKERISAVGGTRTGVGMWIIITILCVLLLSIMLPAYQDYTIRAQLSQSIQRLSGYRVAINDFYQKYNKYPEYLLDLPVPLEKTPNADGVALDSEGILTLTFMAPPQLKGKTVSLIPATSPGGALNWTCVNVNVEPKYLPQNCRSTVNQKATN